MFKLTNLIVLTIIIRLCIWINIPDSYFASDEQSYYYDGLNIISKGVIADFWPPFIPILIGVLSKFISNDLQTLRLFWNIIDVANIILIYFISKNFLILTDFYKYKKLPFFVALSYSFYLPAISFAQFLTSETPSLFLILLTMFFALKFKPSFFTTFLMGLCIGLAILSRTNLLLLSSTIPLAYLYIYGFKSRIFLYALTFFTLAILPLTSYATYNLITKDKFFITSNAPYNLYIGNREHYTEDLNLFYPFATDLQKNDRDLNIKNSSEILTMEEMNTRAMQYIKDNPMIFLRRSFGRLARIFAPKTSQLQLFGGEKKVGIFNLKSMSILIVTAMQYFFILFLGTLGLISLRKLNKNFHTLSIAFIFGCIPLCLIAISKPRYSFPFDFIMLVYAITYLYSFINIKKDFKKFKNILLPIYIFFIWAWVAWLIFAISSRI